MDATQLFLSGIKGCDEYHEALAIVKNNSSGNIWLIGSFVYRTIVSKLYGLPKPSVDLDFIIEVPIEGFDLPAGWKVRKNRFGNPKFVNGKKQVDYIPLDNIYSIKYRGIEATIENFLSGSPLTVQAIAFDIAKQKIIGDVGLNALEERTIAVLDLHFAQYAAQKKGKTLKSYIQEKADSLGFRPIFPERNLKPGRF